MMNSELKHQLAERHQSNPPQPERSSVLPTTAPGSTQIQTPYGAADPIGNASDTHM